MKFLVYGTKGWIGGKVLKYLQENNFEVEEGNSRVENVSQLEEEIREKKPTHVVSLIGRTHGTYEGKYIGTIDYLEKPGKVFENVRDNLFSPMVLSFLSKKHDFHFTYLGTGCIFQFDDSHPFGEEKDGFTEEALPNFFGSSYSIIKGFTVGISNSFIFWSEILSKYLHSALNELPCADIRTFLFSLICF